MFHKVVAKLLRRNLASTPPVVIVDQMLENRPLPIGRAEFEEWSDRIIAGAMLKCGDGEDEEAFVRSQKFALSNMIIHLGPTESHKPDAHFIHQLRKFAINQVAHTIAQELKIKQQEQAAAAKPQEQLPT